MALGAAPSQLRELEIAVNDQSFILADKLQKRLEIHQLHILPGKWANNANDGSFPEWRNEDILKGLMNTANTLFRILMSAAVSVLGTSCGLKVEKTHEPRFNDVLGHTIHTKRPLRLYKIDMQLTGDRDHHYITAGYYPSSKTDSGEIGVLPKGHPVTFHKLRQVGVSGGTSERLLGNTTFHGTNYPVLYYLGFKGDDSAAGWSRIYRSFVVPGKSEH